MKPQYNTPIIDIIIKHAIYSLVTALFLTVILFLFIPRLLFRGDARWTYQSDTARVDVSFAGNLKNGRVDVVGPDIKTTQPKGLLRKNGNQGTSVEVPISYRNRTCQIKLTPKVGERGKDAVLVMEFKGKDFRHKGKRRPAWASFRNITLNGRPVGDRKDVWHDRSFILKCPLPKQEITLTFDVCKPLAASDISLKNIFVIFLAFLLLSLFFTPIKNAVDRVLTFINRKDIVQVIIGGYRNIDPVYRRSFWIILGVLCFAFGFHTICFMWGNHDWPLLEYKRRWLSHAWNGRYMVSSIKVLLFKGVYLPLIYDLIAFVTLALNAILLCRYWRLEKRVTYFVLCGLVLTVQPFTLGMMYYINMIPEVFIGETCVLVALLLSEKIATGGGYIARRIILSVLSFILINLALATYPVHINTIAVAFVGRMLVQSFNWDGSLRQLKAYTMPFVISGINILLGGVVYKLIITYIFPVESGRPNTDTLPLEHVLERMGALFKQSFRQLYEYHDPFISQWILWIFMGFTITLIIYIFAAGTFKQKVVRFCLLLGSLYATQTTMVIAKTHLIAERVELFGLVFFEMLVLALVLKHLRKLRNLCVIAGSCAILASVINDLDCLRVWKLGFDAEKMLWNRVLARLETQKDFNPAGKYDVVQVGKPIALRARFYPDESGRKFNRGDSAPLGYSYNHLANIFGAYEFYYPTRFRSKKRYGTTDRFNLPKCIDLLRRLYQAGVLQKAEVWPKPNGLIVWKGIILFVTDGKELDNFRKKFERELGKR